MDDELLVRLYNVGLGDCIYLRIPDGDADARHVLIDCGNKFSGGDRLRAAIADLESDLPPAGAEAPGKRRLDLLVATHAHEDHIRGFEAGLFENLHIRRIWLSVAMDPLHPQAERTRRLHDEAARALLGLQAAGPTALGALASSLLALSKGEGLSALRETLPAANGIEPLYVHADTPAERLALFEDESDAHLRVLAPMADVDGYYLGEQFEPLSEYLGFGELLAAPPGDDATPEAGAGGVPSNISAADFLRLRERLRCNGLAFALTEGHLVNNTSVVLLLEWRGRRLLFPGDAEVKTAYDGRFREGKSNGSWNVMWEKQRAHLEAPLDFLKVGHHGSGNATPWTARTRRDGRAHPVNAILDALLPPPEVAAPAAQAVVSTERSGYDSIPDPALMAELGRRVAGARRYEEEAAGECFVAADVDQPPRTDLHYQAAGEEALRRVEVSFPPARSWTAGRERRMAMLPTEGTSVEFLYTDAEGNTEEWSGEVTRADPGKEWFRVDTSEGPRTFRYDRVEGEIRPLVTF